VNAPTPPPGWYHDGTQMRWWDGHAWGTQTAAPTMPGPYGTPPARSEEAAGQTLAVLSHAGALIGGFILPLVVYLIEKDKNRFTRHHAAEALNFQLTFLVVIFSTLTVAFVGIASGVPAFAAMFLLLFGAMIAHYVLAVLGMINASRGEWWRYPINIRFVSGAR